MKEIPTVNEPNKDVYQEIEQLMQNLIVEGNEFEWAKITAGLGVSVLPSNSESDSGPDFESALKWLEDLT